MISETCGQDKGIGKLGFTPHTTTAKVTTRLQNKYHPESSQNQDVWKSANQGIKEVAFIQTGRGARRCEKAWIGAEIWNR